MTFFVDMVKKEKPQDFGVKTPNEEEVKELWCEIKENRGK